ncbi:universal stress protein [Vibrio ezurae]|uniref:Universal stress protein n=1 Tax=Vibrio ezurae NBRC 102218 TaxID=1219080 RepID=U3CBR0_9VIBR|nr:universal stress protein [Vibrio ezurae]GAD78759.1 universal stress protein F [Vibrio ezurae NBRC 102218]
MYKQILVPVDLNEKGFSDKALKAAIWHAKQSNAQLHLLNVLPGVHMSMVATYFPLDAMKDMKKDVEAQLRSFADNFIDPELVYHVHIAEGKPYTTIIDYAEKLGADLIVMPSHKRSKIDNVVLGSVATKVVHNSPVNVLVIKPQG